MPALRRALIIGFWASEERGTLAQSMGQAAAKDFRASAVVDGSVDGDHQRCVAKNCVSTKKMQLKMIDSSVGWAFRTGESKIMDEKDKAIYHTTGYSNDGKMYTVRLENEKNKTICLAACKDISGDSGAVIRLLRPDVPAYKGQSDFSGWARESYSPYYPMAAIEVKRSDDKGVDAYATYKVTREGKDGNPTSTLVYNAKIISATGGPFLMSVEEKGGKQVAKIDQAKITDTKNLTLECGKNVDVVGVILMASFLLVTRSSMW